MKRLLIARCLPVTALLPDAAAFAAAYAALPEWRRKKCDAFRFDADKRRSVAAWLLAARLLKESGFDAGSSEVAENEFGKPFFTASGAPRFSLSHAGEMVMAAVADEEVGCDVELVAPVQDGVPQGCLTAEELAFLENRADREREFCRLWVRKESALKALGTGFLREPCGYSVLADAAPEGVMISDCEVSDPAYCAAVAECKGRRLKNHMREDSHHGSTDIPVRAGGGEMTIKGRVPLANHGTDRNVRAPDSTPRSGSFAIISMENE